MIKRHESILGTIMKKYTNNLQLTKLECENQEMLFLSLVKIFFVFLEK